MHRPNGKTRVIFNCLWLASVRRLSLENELTLDSDVVLFALGHLENEISRVPQPVNEAGPTSAFALRAELDGPLVHSTRGLDAGAAGTDLGLTVPLLAI